MQSLMKTIIAQLLKASEAYYGGQETIMSDKEYDDLSAKLEALEAATGLTLPNSPSINVGYASGSPLQKVKHEYKALSLNKTKDISELIDWMGDDDYILSWKCDGLSVILTYDNGKLTRATTRGDGDVGEDITRNAVNFINIPLTISDKRHIVIRGEGVMPYKNFNAVNVTLPPDKRYKNPRNMAAGAAKVLDPEKTASYGIRFIPFKLVNARELGFDRYSYTLDYIDKLGLEPVDWTFVNARNIEEAIDKRRRRVTGGVLSYPTDGLVLHLNDLDICEKLGSTQKAPRYSMAFKWGDKTAETILRGVEWSVSERGYVTPSALFDPLELEGTTVRRANLHSVKKFRELELGIGDRLTVYKANMITPKIHENLDRTGTIDIPTVCPICGNKLEQQLDDHGNIVGLWCTISDCGSRG